MIEMNSDLARRTTFSQASTQARADTFNYEMHQTMDERLGQLRQKQIRPKKRVPWITIISIISIVPLFFMDGFGPKEMAAGLQGMNASPEQMLDQSIAGVSGSEKATVSVTIGGKTITQQLSMSEIQAIQALQQQ